MTSDPEDTTIAPLTNCALRALLRKRGACAESLTWLGEQDAEAAWNACERADWMFWLLGRVGVDRRLIVRAAVACAQPAVTAYVPAGELRPQAALDAALRWTDDPTDANLAQVREARSAAVAYAAAAYADAAYAAYAYDDADAAYAAYAAADAAYAAYAYDDAAYAAYAAAYAAAARQEARAQSLRQSAQVIRDTIPFTLVLATALEAQP